MLQFLVRRLIVAILVAATVMTLAFILTRLSGDLAISIAGPNATQADVEAVRKAYGLDRPLTVQFFDWVGRAATGDLGESYFFKARVSTLIGERMPITLTLGLTGLVIALLVSLPLGILAAVRENTALDRVGPDGGPARPGDAVVLARPDPDDHLRPAARLAADLGHRLVAALRDAGHRARLLGHPRPHAADPRRHDPGHGLGLHPDGARQGPVARLDPAEARAAQRRHPGGGDRRRPARLHAGRLDRDRAGLRPARRRLPRLGDRSARTTSPWCRPSCWCWR